MSDNDPIKLCDFVGWNCDSCGHLITAIEDGWVEWLASESDHGNEALSGLHLVHGKSIRKGKQSCRYDPSVEFPTNKTIVEGLPLERFLGPDGLMVLLSLLAAGEVPQADILELLKRTQIPGYELARNLSRNCSKLSIPALGHGCYLQSEIREVISWALEENQQAQ